MLWHGSSKPIQGVSLSGLFVLEPWITPSLFREWESPNPRVVDEYTYCTTLGLDECSRRLRQHWNTWVTESDIMTLSGLGLNSLSIPIGYWAFTSTHGEPYVQGQIPYLERVLGWAEKYNLDVYLVLQGVPGSQNGFDSSGHQGEVHWQDTQENIERSIAALQGLANIANKYPIVMAIEEINEPASWALSRQGIFDYYKRAYTAIRSIAPQVSVVMSDAYFPPSDWPLMNFPGLSNVFLDTHIFHVFSKEKIVLSREGHLSATCDDGINLRNFKTQVPTLCGAFSLAVTDCARWLNGFGRGSRWDGTLPWEMNGPVHSGATCAGQNSLSTWDASTRKFFRDFAEQQMDSYEHGSGWFFYNFKTEEADDWNYIKLAQNGIIPIPPSNRSSVIGGQSPWCRQ